MTPDESLAQDISAILPMVCVTTVAVTTMKRWFIAHDTTHAPAPTSTK